MSRYRLTPAAQGDLEEIAEYVAADAGDDMSDRVVSELIAAFAKLADRPSLGRPRPDVKNPRFRFWNVNRFVVAFYPDGQPLEIVRIVGARRDFRKLFRRP